MEARGPLPEDRHDPERPSGTTESPGERINGASRRPWVASPWIILLLLGVLVVLMIGIVGLAHRYSAEGRLRSYVPERIRGTCETGYYDLEGGTTHVATDGHPSAMAGLFCDWEGHSPLTIRTEVSITYLLFEDRTALLDAYPRSLPTNCLTDEAGRRICFDPHYFGTFGELRHIVWTDGMLFLTDATVGVTVYQ